MAKIFPYILLLILVLSKFSQAVPLFAGGNEDMVASNRLHRGADRLHQRINPMLDGMRYPYNDNLRRNNYYPISPEQEEEEPETVYVNMNIESDEDEDVDVDTQYVNLLIDTKRNYI